MSNSLPGLFEKRMQNQLGNDFSLFRQSLDLPPTVSIRLNPAKKFSIKSDDRVLWSEYGYYLKERPSFTLDPCFHGGAYYVQEASSMFLEQAVRQSIDTNKKILALDLCAAPGGKSTHLLSLLSSDSLLVSNEVIRSRTTILAENIQKWGHINSVVTHTDPEKLGTLEGLFDLVVVDAPCSGEGLFRKEQDAIHEWSEDNTILCAQRQRRILKDIWPSLKTGGILIYSTCTYNEAENENNLIWLNEQEDTEFLTLQVKPEWGIEEISKSKTIGYRFYPHRTRGEGFFLSVVRKTGDQSSIKAKSKSSLPVLTAKRKVEMNKWILDEEEKVEFLAYNDLILGIPKIWYNEISFLSERLNPATKGTAIAVVKHDKLIPEHALALSSILNLEHFSVRELDRESAIKYLKKESFEMTSPNRGFELVSHQNIPLGWVNQLGNRFNNLYPVNWRIRMNG